MATRKINANVKAETKKPTPAAPTEAPKKETVKTLRADRDMLVSALIQAKDSLEASQKAIEELQTALDYERSLGFFGALFDRLSRPFK